MQRHRGVAPPRFLQQQHELIDRFTARERAGAQTADEIVDVAATLVNIPRHNRQPVNRGGALHGRLRLEDDRANCFAPARQRGLTLDIGGRDPLQGNRRGGNDLTARQIVSTSLSAGRKLVPSAAGQRKQRQRGGRVSRAAPRARNV